MVNSKKVFIAAIVLTDWYALSIQLYDLINKTPGNGMTPLAAVGRFFIFFTVLTNLLVAISLTIILIRPGSVAGRFFSKSKIITAIAVYIFIVGLIYNSVLRSVWHPEGLQKVADECLHVVVPVLFIIYWLLFAAKSSLDWIYAFRWLIFPVVYLVYAMLRGGIEGFYPYPFLNANELTFGKVFMNCAGLFFVFIITGLLFIWVSRLMSRGQKTIS
jgi:hypothetical protein